MKHPRHPAAPNESPALVPSNALDELLECVWAWAFAGFLATPPTERDDHDFQSIVRLDSALHGLFVDGSWERIGAWWNKQPHEQVPPMRRGRS